MSNRAQRRSDTRAFRQQVHHDHILTHLIDVHADLGAYPMLASVATAWRAAIPQRKPFCFGCRASYAKNAQPGAYLFATPRNAADIASVSVLCVECWRDLSKADIERVAANVLRQIAPGGRWIDTGCDR
jgi:hypothetical protein